MGWRPTVVSSVIEVIETSTCPMRVETDAGEAYVKLPNNPDGPHALACDFIGTQLASWLGLPTFDNTLLEITSDLTLPDETTRAGGVAFSTRAVRGQRWGGNYEQLLALMNPSCITGLVVIDTWTRNNDRYWTHADEIHRKLHNVFLSEEAPPGKLQLVAMDFSTALRCGASDLHRRLCGIDQKNDDRVYGLFPRFVPFVARDVAECLAAKLATFSKAEAHAIVTRVPRAWDVVCGNEIVELIADRAAFLAPRIVQMLASACDWQPSPLSDTMDPA